MKSGLGSLEQVFAALADPTRLRIVGLLAGNEDVCVCHLYDALKIPQSKASRHLAYLRRHGIVTATKRGLWVHYRLSDRTDEASARIMRAVREVVAGSDVVRRDAVRLQRRLCCEPARQ